MSPLCALRRRRLNFEDLLVRNFDMPCPKFGHISLLESQPFAGREGYHDTLDSLKADVASEVTRLLDPFGRADRLHQQAS